MLQIRLSKGSAGEESGGAAGSAVKPAASAAVVGSLPSESVTVACPDHLVLADLPVAKSLGVITSSANTALRSLGRRSRRGLGDRVHFCVRCDFPIAIYGRLIPCEHVFCLVCARDDSSCYLCDERIQKIQTIKMMEGVFICAAPHCLKSFLKKSDFEFHINLSHADLLGQQNEKEGGIEPDAPSTAKPSSMEPQRQSSLPELSTARAPPRPFFSPTSNSQVQELDEKNRHHPSQDQPPPKPPIQPRPPPFQLGEQQAENNPSQGFDMQYNWVKTHQNVNQNTVDKSAVPLELPFSSYPTMPLRPPNYPTPMNTNPTPLQVPFTYPAFQPGRSQPYFQAPQETAQRDKMPDNGPGQASNLAFPQLQAGMPNFSENFTRPWGIGFMGVPFESMQVTQGVPQGYANPSDPVGGAQIPQGNYSQLHQGLPLNPILTKPSEMRVDQKEVNGMVGSLPTFQVPQRLQLPPPPPLPQPVQQQRTSTSAYSGSSDINNREVPPGFGWQSDSRRFGTAPD